ncbi:glycosyltransferase [Microbacterium sp. YY-01]|uniref:glycosyltransferase n=1 Tax=Microbacterium sp. YY-01 TaxID=3421634 RepID=UPI003D168E22
MTTRRRIAFVVFNDVYRDSRVLKTADSAVEAGFEARIFAFGGPLSRYPAGVEKRPSGAEIVRLAILPDRLPFMQGVVDRMRARHAARPAVIAPAVPAAAVPESEKPSAAPSQQSTPNTPSKPSVLAAAMARFRRDRMRWVAELRAADFRRRAARSIRAWKPDLVHAHDANTLEVAIDVQRRSGVPFVYDAHELWEERNAVRTPRQALAEKKLLDEASALMAGSITVSPGIQDWMTQRYQLRESPILVRNIPHARTQPASRDQGQLRALTGLTDDDKIVAYVGGITTGRGIDEAIAALAHLPNDVHLVLLGHGADEALKLFRALAAHHGVSDRVHFAGSVPSEQVSTAAADADVSLVFTQPKNLSYIHSLPNKLFESIHAGLPVVASKLPDVTALVTHYGVGELVEPDDIEAMAQAIGTVLADSAAYRERSLQAAQELTWQGEMARLHELYDAVQSEPERRVQ